ncbi:MAG TPA: glycosyltransferase [Chryseosolibacter sp.]|nr:glycosyltransferase [Chryseosolibacter sp.]
MISVIIPTYNNEGFVSSTISFLKTHAYTRLLKEIIVVDAGSTDRTLAEARAAGATILRSMRKGRSVQMNLGAECATGQILYFITPGTTPPANYCNEIVRSYQKKNYLGTFTMEPNQGHWLTKALSWYMNVKQKYSRLENQSLFVDRELFVKAGGFHEDLLMMEDHELVIRLQRYSRFDIIRKSVQTCANGFSGHRVFRTEMSYMLSFWLYENGISTSKIQKLYSILAGERKQEVPQVEPELSASFN